MPAAAVIPAPIAYIKVVAVKKLVVGFLSKTIGPPIGCVSGSVLASFRPALLHLTVCHDGPIFYFEEIRVFQAGTRLEYSSME